MSSSNAGAAAFNAGVRINGEEITLVAPRTSQEQAYLDQIANQSEAAVDAVKAQIAGLQESLKDREAEAVKARAAAQGEEG